MESTKFPPRIYKVEISIMELTLWADWLYTLKKVISSSVTGPTPNANLRGNHDPFNDPKRVQVIKIKDL
jgi:hypothetical protein